MALRGPPSAASTLPAANHRPACRLNGRAPAGPLRPVHILCASRWMRQPRRSPGLVLRSRGYGTGGDSRACRRRMLCDMAGLLRMWPSSRAAGHDWNTASTSARSHLLTIPLPSFAPLAPPIARRTAARARTAQAWHRAHGPGHCERVQGCR